jgi:hypothetical protein
MENYNLLDGTIIAEALAYDDEIEPVREDGIFISGQVVDEMNEMEIRLHSLSVLKNRQIKMMFEDIIGKRLEDTSKDEGSKNFIQTITTEHNFHYYEKFDRLQREAVGCLQLMWILIYLRVPCNHAELVIRPGFKIIELANTENSVIPGLGKFNFS